MPIRCVLSESHCVVPGRSLLVLGRKLGFLTNYMTLCTNKPGLLIVRKCQLESEHFRPIVSRVRIV